jgi:cyanophycinase
MEAKGKIVIIGGAEDKGQESARNGDGNNSSFNNGVLKRLIDESAKKEKSRIEIVTTASTVPDSIGGDYLKAFSLLKAENAAILKIETREQANEPGMLKRLEKAHIVLFTGGDQMRLTSILGSTLFLERLYQKYREENFIYAGSSAGAAAVSNNMVFQGRSEDALRKGEVRITSGLGLLNNVVVDTHFVKRGRIGRLFHAVVANPRILGIGMEENAALLITKGSIMEAIGPEMTILVDGRHITDTNINDIEDGEAISVSNLTVHVMSRGDRYRLKEHSLELAHPG